MTVIISASPDTSHDWPWLDAVTRIANGANSDIAQVRADLAHSQRITEMAMRFLDRLLPEPEPMTPLQFVAPERDTALADSLRTLLTLPSDATDLDVLSEVNSIVNAGACDAKTVTDVLMALNAYSEEVGRAPVRRSAVVTRLHDTLTELREAYGRCDQLTRELKAADALAATVYAADAREQEAAKAAKDLQATRIAEAVLWAPEAFRSQIAAAFANGTNTVAYCITDGCTFWDEFSNYDAARQSADAHASDYPHHDTMTTTSGL